RLELLVKALEGIVVIEVCIRTETPRSGQKLGRHQASSGGKAGAITVNVTHPLPFQKARQGQPAGRVQSVQVLKAQKEPRIPAGSRGIRADESCHAPGPRQDVVEIEA